MHSLHINGLFERFVRAIASIADGDAITRRNLLNETFRLARDGDRESFYAPFDYVNRDAKLVLIGITPGWAQQIAYREAAHVLRDGATATEACSRAKRAVSFAGNAKALKFFEQEHQMPEVASESIQPPADYNVKVAALRIAY